MKKIIFTLMAMLFSTMCYCQNGVWKGEGVTFIFEEEILTIVDTISIGDVKRERISILGRDSSNSEISIARNESIYYYLVETLFGIKKIKYKTNYTKFDDERIILKIYSEYDFPITESKSFSLTKDVKASEAFKASKTSKALKRAKVKDNVDGVYAF